jgi:hypothetical protein
MLLSQYQNTEQNYDIKIANRYFENVAHFRYLETTVKRSLNSGNACNHSVQDILSSHLLSKNIRIRIYKTLVLSVVLYGCETWHLTLREKHRLKVFENRVLRRIFEPKRDEGIGGWKKPHNEGFITCTFRQI